MKAKIECPYPGLRPFQEHESAFFFGRECQIEEIVNRLKNSRFVAVLGGSGSGKSSLVLAGAIPELRAEAIEGAGDFWVPVITSPGTNPKNSSPITRMAEKFCALLEPFSDEKMRHDRIEDCESLLRTPNGLSLLINKYGRDLGEKHRDGVDLQLAGSNGDRLDANDRHTYLVKVNFLFLIDQFEELFHPSNDQVKDDCRHLVQRIVDHFQQCKLGEDSNQSTRLCVAITMRSEHLNDCTRYADLPDAINAAVYLVKRLNRQEIVEAIIKPVDAFLRQQFRQAVSEARKDGTVAPDKKSWPREIQFSSKVIDRLMLDTDSIVTQQDHADLLPLLQHLLYWIWICAVVRTRSNAADGNDNACLPDAITVGDLDAALTPYDMRLSPPGLGTESPRPQKPRSWLRYRRTDLNSKPAAGKQEEDCNALTACLEKRCEWIFRRRENDSVRACWEKIFPNLAFKDPNTGTYTQRRVDIRDLCQRHAASISADSDISTRIQQLKQHLQPWLGEELGYHQYLYWDQGSETLKVTHESLIRRWKRFREWIDWKDRQFMEYVQALENCSRWRQDGKKWGDLISDGVILERIKEYELRESLKDEGLKTQFTDLLKLHRDKSRLAEGEDSLEDFLKGSFKKRLFKNSGIGLLFLLPVLLVLWLNSSIEGVFKDKKDNLLRASAIAAETRLVSPPAGIVEGYDQALVALRNFLAAVGLKNKSVPEPMYAFIYKEADWGLYADDREKEYQYRLWSESRILGGLRSALLGRVWRPKEDGGSVETAVPLPCKAIDIAGSDEYKAGTGTFFTSDLLPEYRKNIGLLAVTVVGRSSESGTQVFWAKKEGDVCRSHIGQKLWWADKDSTLGVDAYLNYMVEFQRDRATTIVAIDWPIGDQPGDGQSLSTPQQFKLADIKSMGLNAGDRYVLLPTLRPNDQFSEDIQIDRVWLRFFNRGPVSVDKPCDADAMSASSCKRGTKISGSGKDSQGEARICGDWLGKVSMKGNEGVWQIQYNKDVFCLIVSSSAGAEGRYFGDLYQVRTDDEDHLPLISGISLGSKQPDEIRLEFASGWIFSRLDDHWFQQPWSTDAWVKLAGDIDLPLPLSECLKDNEAKSRYTKFKGHLKDNDFDLDHLAAQAISAGATSQSTQTTKASICSK